MRVYTNKGQGISTKIRSNRDGKKYIISTAKDPKGFWQLAVFRSVFGFSNPYKSLRVTNSPTFEEAEKKHFDAEELVANSPVEEWQNWD
ncbi:MAG: hypothetical protein ABSF79_01605 [Smithellaceae bacterium]|jgi:hypothetical protein